MTLTETFGLLPQTNFHNNRFKLLPASVNHSTKRLLRPRTNRGTLIAQIPDQLRKLIFNSFIQIKTSSYGFIIQIVISQMQQLVDPAKLSSKKLETMVVELIQIEEDTFNLCKKTLMDIQGLDSRSSESKSSGTKTQAMQNFLPFDNEYDNNLKLKPDYFGDSSNESNEESFPKEDLIEEPLAPQVFTTFFNFPVPVAIRIPSKLSPLQKSQRLQARMQLALQEEPANLYRYRTPFRSSNSVVNNFRTRLWNHLDQSPVDRAAFLRLLGGKRQKQTNNLVRFSACFRSPELQEECLNFFLNFATQSIITSSKASFDSKRSMLSELGVFTQGAKKGYIHEQKVHRRKTQ